MSCMCILEINPLSVVSFAIIFSHSQGFPFTLPIVFFAVKKLLSLIRGEGRGTTIKGINMKIK